MAAQSLFPIEPAAEEQRLVVSGVPWETYIMLREALDHTNLRMMRADHPAALREVHDELRSR